MIIGEVFLDALFDALFEKLSGLLSFAPGGKIDADLRKWNTMLRAVSTVLADAEEKQTRTDQKAIKQWLEDLEDFAYDLDDLLDEFSTEALRQQVLSESQGSTSKVRKLMHTCFTRFNASTIVSDFRMRSKMDEITTSLKDLFDRRIGLGLQNVDVGHPTRPPQRPPTSSLIHEPRLYGRDGDQKAIIDLLLRDQSNNGTFDVVPIVGMGGVGKTTLAQMVYNNEIVQEHFEMKAWVCVSEEFDIMGVTKAILESITSQSWDLNTLDQVQVKLKSTLDGKKFLIVLDDVWNKNHGDWSKLQSPFSNGSLGSKVIVTTRIRDVALTMTATNKYHPLKELSEDDCWSVFVQHAFRNKDLDASPNFVSLGRKIVKKCRGLPLAARTLGGLLQCKWREDEWEEVLNNKIWELSDEESNILPALRISYYHLPSHLKKCFAYCSVLPKDYDFEEKELVFWWMAEGLIKKPTGQKQMEDLGCEYFRELVSRSLFQPSSSGDVSLFAMHDLINDLAQFVARRVCFNLEEKLENNEGDTIITKARHSSYIRGDLDGIEKFEIFKKAKNLRSFLPFGLRDRGINKSTSYLTSNVPFHLLPSLTSLRTLSLRRYLICELSSSIGDLKHVRFLDLSCALIANLPESVGTLYNLQTLILRDCKNLTKLPETTSNLINLRHLDLTGADSLQEMPPKLDKLRSLQTLSNFIVNQGNGSAINELGSLIHLGGTLYISGLENVEDALDARRANLKDKQRLDVVLMKWSNISDNSRDASVEFEVLDMLRPHKKLKELTISGYHGLIFPTWVGIPSFSHMVSLSLQNCENCTFLPPLGHLPSLTRLSIQGMKAVQMVGPNFYGSGCLNPFPALECLTFDDMPEWKEWSHFEVKVGAQVFSRLSELSIKRCPKLLGKLPNNLPCLRKLDVKDCPLLVVPWVPSPVGLLEGMITAQFDSLTTLSLRDVSSPVGLLEGMITAQFDSLTNLYLGDVSILDSFNNPDVCNDPVVAENARYSHLSSLRSLTVANIQGLTCLASWFFLGLNKLQELSIIGCEALTSFWKNEDGIYHRLPALRRLVIEHCPLLISLFEEDDEEEALSQHAELPYMMLLEYLEIGNCKKMEKLPRGLHNLVSLQELIIRDCPCLISFPETGLPSTLRCLRIGGCKGLRSLPELTMLNSLETLEVRSCPLLTCCSRTGLPCNLKKLKIEECEKLESVLLEGGTKIHCPCLESVEVRECKRLKSLPDVTHSNFDGGSLKNLTLFRLEDCENVESIPEGWFTATNLRELWVYQCKKLKGLPHHAYNNLTPPQMLYMYDCDAATALSYLQSLTRRSCDAAMELTPLQMLYIRSCDAAMELISSSSHFTNLTLLKLRDISMGGNKPPSQWGLHRLSSLTTLDLRGYGGASFPLIEGEEEDGTMPRLPPSLLELNIRGFPNLEKLSFKGFQNIPSLEYLIIWGCPNLSTITNLGLLPSLSHLHFKKCPKLPSFSAEEQRQLPPSLLSLDIWRCPILKQRCEKKKGQYWPLISHLPQVEIDDRNVFDPRS